MANNYNSYIIHSNKYRWKPEIKNKLKYINKQFLKKINKNIINTFIIDLSNPYFKLIKLTVYIAHDEHFNLENLDITNNDHINFIINYINDPNNFKDLSKFDIIICENINILKIMDINYNIFKLTEYLNSDARYKLMSETISNLIKNIIDIL